MAAAAIPAGVVVLRARTNRGLPARLDLRVPLVQLVPLVLRDLRDLPVLLVLRVLLVKTVLMGLSALLVRLAPKDLLVLRELARGRVRPSS